MLCSSIKLPLTWAGAFGWAEQTTDNPPSGSQGLSVIRCGSSTEERLWPGGSEAEMKNILEVFLMP